MPTATDLPHRSCRRRAWTPGVAVLLLVLTGAAGEIAADTPAPLLTGTALGRRLQGTVSVKWSDVPLRQALAGISTAYHVAILLDRRIDPDQLVRYTAADQSLEAVLRSVAQDRGAAVARLADVLYLGPVATATRLRTIAAMNAEEVRQLAEAPRRAWQQRAEFSWSELAEPRPLIEQWAVAAQARLTGLEQLPLDLWPAFRAPPLTLADRVTLVAAEFDLRLVRAAGNDGLQLAPWPAEVAVERTFRAQQLSAERLERWLSDTPSATARRDGDTVVVRALLEELERLAGTSAPPRRTARHEAAAVRHRFVVRSMPLGRVLEELQTRLGWKFVYDAAALDRAGIKLTDPITVDVSEADDEQLLEAVCRPRGLEFKRAGAEITLQPAQKSPDADSSSAPGRVN
ncbi:MAG: hypothetical protein K1X74_14550 [Pirellulales bacterium]|nr:hypothetical protein [Pirellulales bacterium]